MRVYLGAEGDHGKVEAVEDMAFSLSKKNKIK